MEITSHGFLSGFQEQPQPELPMEKAGQGMLSSMESSVVGAVGAHSRSPSFLKGLPFSINCSP